MALVGFGCGEPMLAEYSRVQCAANIVSAGSASGSILWVLRVLSSISGFDIETPRVGNILLCGSALRLLEVLIIMVVCFGSIVLLLLLLAVFPCSALRILPALRVYFFIPRVLAVLAVG